jgi:anti-sigma factor RsiW
MTVIPLDRATHEEVQALLPWYLTQRLDATELALVERHLAVCAHCRAELALERRLQDALAGLPAGDRVEQSLARLRPQLQARLRHSRWGWPRRVFAAVVVLAVPATLVGLWPAYRALGPVAAPANLIVKFRPDITAKDVPQHLPEGVRLVGTTVTQAWLLSVPVPRRDQALARLKADPAVLVAEPLDAGAPQ